LFSGFCAHFVLGFVITGVLKMNFHAPRLDRSPEAVAKRKKATDQARAANMRQGYVHDPLLEAATAAYVAGDITRDEYRERVVRKPQ
jgi:hypothetical protein